MGAAAGDAVGVGTDPPACGRQPATAAATSSRNAATGRCRTDLLPSHLPDDGFGEIGAAVEYDGPVEHHGDPRLLGGGLHRGADLLVEPAEQLVALVENLLLELAVELLALERRHAFAAVLELTLLGLEELLEGALRTRLARVTLERPLHLHEPDRERLPERRRLLPEQPGPHGEDHDDPGGDDDLPSVDAHCASLLHVLFSIGVTDSRMCELHKLIVLYPTVSTHPRLTGCRRAAATRRSW